MLKMGPAASTLEDNAFKCSKQNNMNTLKSLLEKSPQLVDMVDRKNRSLLMVSCACGSIDAVTLLLDKGADINLRSSNRYTALHYAVESNNNESTAAIVDLLLKKGIDPICEDLRGLDAINLAQQRSNYKLVRLLEKKCGDFGCWLEVESLKMVHFTVSKVVGDGFLKNHHSAIWRPVWVNYSRITGKGAKILTLQCPNCLKIQSPFASFVRQIECDCGQQILIPEPRIKELHCLSIYSSEKSSMPLIGYDTRHVILEKSTLGDRFALSIQFQHVANPYEQLSVRSSNVRKVFKQSLRKFSLQPRTLRLRGTEETTNNLYDLLHRESAEYNSSHVPMAISLPPKPRKHNSNEIDEDVSVLELEQDVFIDSSAPSLVRMEEMTHIDASAPVVERIDEVIEGNLTFHYKSLDIYTCPLTKTTMRDPVLTCDGQSYEREAIAAWFHDGNTCSPLNGMALEHQIVFPNTALLSAIQALQSNNLN